MQIMMTYTKGDKRATTSVTAYISLHCQCGESEHRMSLTGFLDKKTKSDDERGATFDGQFKGWIIGEEYDTCPSCANKSQEGK